MSSVKKQQHYVFEYYLKAWAETRSFCCYSKSRSNLFPTDPERVGKRRYFYQLKRLTEDDRLLIELVLGRVDSQLRRFHAEFVDRTQHPFDVEDALAIADLLPEQKQEIECALREYKANLIENLHTHFEGRAIPLLASMKRYDASFYADTEQCLAFLNYLLHQYFRTENLRRRIGALPNMASGHSFERTALIFNLIHATSAALSLFRDRNCYKIVFLRNTTDEPFLAGDQPVINLLDPADTDEVELYYPVSPKTAILLTCDKDKAKDKIIDLSEVAVEAYNLLIYRSASDQVYSSDPAHLESFIKAANHSL